MVTTRVQGVPEYGSNDATIFPKVFHAPRTPILMELKVVNTFCGSGKSRILIIVYMHI